MVTTITTVKVKPDLNPMSPREWDNLGVMVCDHGGYNLGDRKMERNEELALRRGGWKLLERYCRRYYGTTTLLKLGLYDHSGLHMYVGGGEYRFDPGGWDSGTVGWIMDTRETREMIGTPPELIEQVLSSEVEEYDQFLRGDIYGFIVEHRELCSLCQHIHDQDEPKDNVLPDECPHCKVEEDSCWGFHTLDEDNGMKEYVAEEHWPLLKQALENPEYD